jgi:hypothetical protein
MGTEPSEIELLDDKLAILGVGREPAIEVLNMSWRRWTSAERRDLAHRRDELKARRDQLL